MNRALEFIKQNKAVTLKDEVIAHISDITDKELNDKETKKALKQNQTIMKLMLKTKLFKSNTAKSLLELNKILENEENNDKISNYIDEIAERWKNEF